MPAPVVVPWITEDVNLPVEFGEVTSRVGTTAKREVAQVIDDVFWTHAIIPQFGELGVHLLDVYERTSAEIYDPFMAEVGVRGEENFAHDEPLNE